MPVLKTSAVPGIPSTTRPLTSADLAKDSTVGDAASRISSFGYLGGMQRTFQGESRRNLSLVVSRSLVFRDPSGASAFVAFVHDNAPAYFGDGSRVRPLSAQGRAGWLFTLAPCACHMATPAYVGLVSQGDSVTWLEINGSDATPALLSQLLQPPNSAPPG
jgi:hypothetical protein